MKNFKSISVFLGALMIVPIISCGDSSQTGFTKIDYKVNERERYDNIFRDNIPEQWSNYGIGDPFLMRWNGEYYLYVSTKDNNPGHRVWKSHNLVNFEYLGQKGIFNKDGVSTDGQLGQYAPEIYYWNGDFYMFGSPSGNGHFIYKSDNRRPDGNFVAVTDNFGCSIDGSLFIDDDETMTMLTAGDGAIQAYEMTSITSVDKTSRTQLLSPLIKWTEGPCIIKHDGTYYLTYTGNHVKSRGYRIDYSYSNESPLSGFKYPVNNSIALSTLTNQNGLGHSSTVLGPNLDSYYISYHSLDDASGPIRSYNINRISMKNNRVAMYGPNEKGNLVPVLPDFVSYGVDETKMNTTGEYVLTKQATQSRFSAEYNFTGITPNGSMKLFFSVENNNYSNYITINGKSIELYVGGSKIGSGTLKNDFDFSVLHTIRISHDNGRYAVFFDNLEKITVSGKTPVSGGLLGYSNVNEIGTTTFANDAFDSSDRRDPKMIKGEFFAENYLEESKLSSESFVHDVEKDDIDSDYLYTDSKAVTLAKKGDYLLFPIDSLKDSRYGLEILHNQLDEGCIFSIQIDNNSPTLMQCKKTDFTKNSNCYEDKLQYIKEFVGNLDISKGLHTLKIELVEGKLDLIMVNMFNESKYSPDYSNDLSTYVEKGASYLSLWKLVEDGGIMCHKAKAGVNNMILFGDDTLTDYEASVDIKVSVSSANNSMVGMIVRCNNPSLYSGYIDQSAQGYFVGFNRMQLAEQRINYNVATVNVDTGDAYTLGEWHNLKIVCKGSTNTTYFDGVKVFSYTDAYPFSHGLIALYSVNAESYFKNLIIKGI